MAKLMDAMSKKQQTNFFKMAVSNQYDSHVLAYNANKKRYWKKYKKA